MVPQRDGDFGYRRLGILGDPKRLSIVVFGIDRSDKDVEEGVEKVLRLHELNTIELVNERVVEEDGKRALIFDSLEYRIVDGKLVSEEVGKVDPGLMGETSK
jgi:hypothetical protein